MGFMDPVIAAERDGRARAEATRRATDPTPTETYAGIARDEWRDYLDRFAPYEDAANALVMDPARRGEIRDQALGIATDSVASSFARAGNRMETLRSRTNQAPSAREAESEGRLSALDQSRATVGARGAVRGAVRDREMQILGGGGAR